MDRKRYLPGQNPPIGLQDLPVPYLTPSQLAPNHHRPCRIDAMHLKHRLGEINPIVIM